MARRRHVIAGRLAVTARLQSPATVELRFADNGPGVAPELLEKIFEPLFTTKARGIGLGLAVSRALVLANAGDIAVVSEPGRGATFIVTLPAVPARSS